MLTYRKLKSLKPRETEYTIADRDGLSIRVRPSGAMSWIFRYQYLGKPYRLTIGSFNQEHPDAAMSFQQAQGEARRLNSILERGENPKSIREQEQQERIQLNERKEQTFEKLFKEFDEKVLSQRVRPEAARRMIERDIMPALRKRPAHEISRKEILTILDGICQRKHTHTLRNGAPTTANRLLSLLKQIFKFASQRDWVPFNPLTDVTREAVGGRERARDRALDETEIRILLSSLHEWKTDPQNIRFIKFLLSSGQRIATCAGALWCEFDLENKVWRIPPSDDDRATKTTSNNSRRLPLSPYMYNILQEQYKHSAICKYVWPPLRSRDYGKPFNYQSINLLLRSNNHAGLRQFTPHDLRRSMITRMADIGIPPHVPEKICGHTLSGMLRVYNHSEYYREQQQALESWGNYLTALEVPNVIPIKTTPETK